MNLKNFVLGIAIFVLTISVGIYGIRSLYGEGPQYEDFCMSSNPSTPEECISKKGEWINTTSYKSPSEPVFIGGYCNLDSYYTECNKGMNNAREIYNKKIFLIALPLGIVVIVLGAVAFGLVAVGTGIMSGGVGIIVYGVIGFWEFANDLIKFIITLIGLIIIIVLAYYINRKIKK